MKKFKFNGQELNLVFNIYSETNALSFELHTEFEPYARISTNLPGSKYLPGDCFYAKHWGGQQPIIDELLKQGVISKIDAPTESSGFIDKIYAYKINDAFKEICHICENWVCSFDSPLLTCKKCNLVFCTMCGSTISETCDSCLDEMYDDFDSDGYEEESW